MLPFLTHVTITNNKLPEWNLQKYKWIIELKDSSVPKFWCTEFNRIYNRHCVHNCVLFNAYTQTHIKYTRSTESGGSNKYQNNFCEWASSGAQWINLFMLELSIIIDIRFYSDARAFCYWSIGLSRSLYVSVCIIRMHNVNITDSIYYEYRSARPNHFEGIWWAAILMISARFIRNVLHLHCYENYIPILN